MEMNPLTDLVMQAKDKQLSNQLKSIADDIKSLKGQIIMPKFIELEMFQECGSNRMVKKVSINPEYIVFIKEDGEHSFVYMSNESVLHVISSRDEILNFIKGDIKTAIG